MTYLAEHALYAPRRARPVPPRRIKAAESRPRCRDPRWPALASALVALRASQRSSVRIVDAECGAGTLLLCAVRFARTLGFTAIEGRGIDDAPAAVGRACATAAELRDPAIAITFESGDLVDALSAEADFPADIVLWHGRARRDADARRAVERVVARAGHTLIADIAIGAGV